MFRRIWRSLTSLDWWEDVTDFLDGLFDFDDDDWGLN